MAWKALRNLNGYTLDLFYSGGQVIENPDAVQDNSPVTFGNTPVSKSSLPASTGELWFNITNNLAINFCFNYVGDSSYSSNTAHCWIYLNSQTNPGYWLGSFGCGGNYPRYVAYSIFIDDEKQKACIVWRHHYKYRWGQPGALYDDDSRERSRSEYDSAIYTEIKSVMVTASNGGGVSHIAKVTGQLSTLSSNLSDILMVSGGGGGGMIIGTTVYDGKDAGGISGSGDNSADQSTGNAFGQGESGSGVSGGGSGLYGGYKGTSENSGGAGSGYIANSSLVSYTAQKKMVGYNVPTSSAGATKTESVNTNDVNPEPNTPKINNGHIRIKYIREEVIPSYLSEVGTYLIGRPDNKQHLKTVPKWGNGNYDWSADSQWSWPMSLYHPNTNINSDSIALASFPDGATINIDTTAGINVTYTGFTASRLFFRYGYWRARIGLSWEDPLASTPKGAYWCGYESGNDSQYEPTKNDFTSLDQLFEYIYNHFRHCNVVLNGTTIVTESSE